MPASISSQPQFEQSHADAATRIGGWLFRRRTIIPAPLALAVLLIPAHAGVGDANVLVPAGAALVAAGELLRLWSVRHIGVISRTRSDRLGPLVASGPFRLIRNPLYVGNIVLWAGFALAARLLWLAPLFVLLLGFEYHAIVRWEEQLLEARLGEGYRSYAARVPRWVPKAPAVAAAPDRVFSWRDTFYSERGTLVAIALGFALLWLKAQGAWFTV
jgi:protein-S-isoprenylcysteine O-methyltransferase Ste14